MRKNKLLKLKLSLLIFILFPLLSNIFAFEVYVPIELKTEVETNVYLGPSYICDSFPNCQNPSQVTQITYQVYDFNSVANCFSEYNINNIHECIANGEISGHFHLVPGQTKKIIIKYNSPDNNPHTFYTIANADNTIDRYVYFSFNSIPKNINYINVVYYYLHGKKNSIGVFYFKPINLNNQKSVVIKNFNVKNKIDIHYPLLIQIPVEVNNSLCSLLVPYIYVPSKEYKDFKGDIKLKIIDQNGNIVFEQTKTKVFYANTVCNGNEVYVNFEWTPQNVGNYTIEVIAKGNPNYIVNDVPDAVSEEVEVYDTSQQYCYSNIQNIQILNSTGGIVYYSNDNLKVIFDVLSGISQGDGSFTGTSTKWEIYVDNQLKYSGITNNNFDYKHIEKDLNLNPGSHVIKIKAKALNCPYNNNQPIEVVKSVTVLDANQENSNPGNQGNNGQNNNSVCDLPEIDFQINPQQGKPPLLVHFSVIFENVNCEKNFTIKYDYDGDNEYEEIKDVVINSDTYVLSSYTYSQAGTYNVKIDVYSDNSLVVSKTETITVQAPEENQPVNGGNQQNEAKGVQDYGGYSPINNAYYEEELLENKDNYQEPGIDYLSYYYNKLINTQKEDSNDYYNSKDFKEEKPEEIIISKGDYQKKEDDNEYIDLNNKLLIYSSIASTLLLIVILALLVI